MEEKDRPLISWKAISIILIILILAYAGYKGFAYGQTALENYLLPKMLTAGLVTVTLVSVFFAGFAVNYL